jgi:hypothetical protein
MRRRGKASLRVVIVGLVLAVVGGCASELVSGTAAPAGGVAGGADAGAADAPLDGDRLLDEFLLALATQPVVHVRMEQIRDVPAFHAGQEYNHGFTEGGFDFRTNEYFYHQDHGFQSLCSEGIEYSWDSFDEVWNPGSPCEITTGGGMLQSQNSLALTGTVSDGVLTSGLSRPEAEAWVNAMRADYPGYLRPGEPRLVDHAGAQYVRLPVVLPAVDADTGKKYGMAVLNWAFRDIGPRHETHVLRPATAGAMISQVEAVFYLDPTTRLPAYSEVLIYEPTVDPQATEGTLTRTEFLWDGAVPHIDPATAAPTPTPPSWPAEKLSPGAVR